MTDFAYESASLVFNALRALSAVDLGDLWAAFVFVVMGLLLACTLIACVECVASFWRSRRG